MNFVQLWNLVAPLMLFTTDTEQLRAVLASFTAESFCSGTDKVVQLALLRGTSFNWFSISQDIPALFYFHDANFKYCCKYLPLVRSGEAWAEIRKDA